MPTHARKPSARPAQARPSLHGQVFGIRRGVDLPPPIWKTLPLLPTGAIALGCSDEEQAAGGRKTDAGLVSEAKSRQQSPARPQCPSQSGSRDSTAQWLD